MTDPRHILIARFGAIGDLLLSTPVVRALKRRYPGARLSYIVGKGLGDVLAGHPDLDAVLEFDKRADARPLPALRFGRALRAQRFDLYVNLQRSVKTILFGAASGARQRLTYRRANDPLTGGLLHAVDNYLRTLGPLGIDAQACDRHLDFHVPPRAGRQLRALLSTHGIGDGDRLVVVNPGASAAARRWPPAALAGFLDHATQQRPDLRFALIGGRGDDQRLARETRALMRHPQAVLDWVAAVDLKQTGALLQRADAMLSTDTGPMHIASAVGTPLVALFGASAPERTGPCPPPPGGRRVAPIALAPVALDCFPCHARECRRGDVACLAGQPPQRLLQALETQLAAAANAPAASGPAVRRRALTA